MHDTEHTEYELVDIINWREKILLPLILAVLFGIGVSLLNTRDTVAEVVTKMEVDDDREDQDRINDAARAQEQKMMRASQAEFKLQIQEMRIRQEYILEDVAENKVLNERILKILTDNVIDNTL